MTQTTLSTAESNRALVADILMTAADVVDRSQPHDQPDVVAAISEAKMAVLDQEPAQRKALRSYGAAEILPDFGRYIGKAFPEFKPTAMQRSPVSLWCRNADTRTVAETLRAAAAAVSDDVYRRSIAVEQRKRLSDKERDQLATLDQLVQHFASYAVAADIRWDKPYDAFPAEFNGTINGARWAFVVTEITRAGARFNAETHDLANPVQSALQFAYDDAVNARGETKTDCAQHCWVIRNAEFGDPTQWRNVELARHPFDAIAIAHENLPTASTVWQLVPETAFGDNIPSQTVRGLAAIVQQRQKRNPSINPKSLEQAWKAIEAANLTEDDILRIAQEG